MKYLSEVRDFLPKNCLFDKGRVGCGGTTLAIKCSEKYVIAVPFVGLVDNKCSQHSNLFGVKAEITVEDIKNYVESASLPKIITTYDSLNKVIEAIDPKEFNLLVDEYHLLFSNYTFRYNAVRKVLDNFKLFKNYTFMTATPIESEFILDELKELPVVTQEWNDSKIVNVSTIKCVNVEASTLRIIEYFINGTEKGNAYFFVNSVKFIKKIINKIDAKYQDDIRVICANNEVNNKLIKQSLRGTCLDAPKKLNFITSTAFEGQDIFDTEGKTYIISDGLSEHTLLDIATTIQQIAGRIRNTKYYNCICHLYSQNRYTDVSYEDFKKIQEETKEEALIASKDYNNMNIISRKGNYSDTCENIYITATRENYTKKFDINRLNLDTYNYKVCNNYSLRVNLSDAYMNNEKYYNSLNQEWFLTLQKMHLDRNLTGIEFRDAVKEILSQTTEAKRDEIFAMYTLKYPILIEIDKTIGLDRCSALMYVQSVIKQEILTWYQKNDISNDILIIKELNLHNGCFITSMEVIKKLQKIYDKLGIKVNAKSKDLDKWFDTKYASKRIDGTVTKGYIIIRPKYELSQLS